MAQTENYKALSKLKTKANKIEKSITEFKKILADCIPFNIVYDEATEGEKKLIDDTDLTLDRINELMSKITDI